MENECVGCGCTDHNACVVDGVACHWLIVDHVLGIGVCSCCQGSLSEFKKEQERIVDSIENLKGIADTLTDEVFELRNGNQQYVHHINGDSKNKLVIGSSRRGKSIFSNITESSQSTIQKTPLDIHTYDSLLRWFLL